MSDSIQAIPTEYAGVRFKSRLEARFAEYLDAVRARWVYEPQFPGENPSYQPDFFLPELKLYVEIKPKARIEELWIFWDEIDNCSTPFVCIDKDDRNSWVLLICNSAFRGHLRFRSTPVSILIGIWDCLDGNKRVTLVLNSNSFLNVHESTH